MGFNQCKENRKLKCVVHQACVPLSLGYYVSFGMHNFIQYDVMMMMCVLYCILSCMREDSLPVISVPVSFFKMPMYDIFCLPRPFLPCVGPQSTPFFSHDLQMLVTVACRLHLPVCHLVTKDDLCHIII